MFETNPCLFFTCIYRFVDDSNSPTEAYPFNPNGSPDGVAGLCSEDGRHLAVMPHPERCFLTWQVSRPLVLVATYRLCLVSRLSRLVSFLYAGVLVKSVCFSRVGCLPSCRNRSAAFLTVAGRADCTQQYVHTE